MSVADSEGKRLAVERAQAVAALSWEQLDAYGKTEEDVVTASGERFRVSTHVFWDIDDWESDLYLIVKARPEKGWRRFWPYKAVEVLGGETIPPRPD